MCARKVLLQQHGDRLLVGLQAAVLRQPGQDSRLHRASSRHMEGVGRFFLSHLLSGQLWSVPCLLV